MKLFRIELNRNPHAEAVTDSVSKIVQGHMQAAWHPVLTLKQIILLVSNQTMRKLTDSQKAVNQPRLVSRTPRSTNAERTVDTASKSSMGA